MENLLRTQFMLVRWQQSISHYVAWLPKEQEDKMTESEKEYLSIELDVVIQINGGLRSFTRWFSIGKVKLPDDYPCWIGTSREAITLTDWKAWREFYDVLYDMGYYLSEEKSVDTIHGYSIIKKWIQEVFPDRHYYEDYDGIATKQKDAQSE